MKKKLFMLFAILATASYGSDAVVELKSSHIKKDVRSFVSQPKEVKNTFTVTQEKIRENNYKNVEEILEDAPGIIVNNTAFGPKIDMRGNGEKSFSKVKVMVDGISINPTEEAMASLPINSIPIESIKKIDIIPGGGATLYGSGSVGGVVNIITNSNATKNNFFMDMKYGSYDNRSFGFAGGHNLTDSLYVNYGFNYINSEGYREGENKEDVLFLGGFDYKINDKNKIRFQARHGKQEFDTTTDVAKRPLDEKPWTVKENLANNRKQKGLNMDTDATNDSYTLDFEHRFNDKLSFGVTGYRQEQDRKIQAESIDTTTIALEVITLQHQDFKFIFPNITSNMDARFKETKEGIKLKTSYNSDFADMIFGYDYFKGNNKRTSHVKSEILKGYNTGYIHETLAPEERKPLESFINIDLTKEVNSLYQFTKIKATDNLDFTFGGRGEWTKFEGERKNGPNTGPMISKPKYGSSSVDKKMTNYAGELGALYKYSDTGSTYLRYERAFVTPFASQLTDKIRDITYPKETPLGNPPRISTASLYVDNGLKSEKTDTIELGFRDYFWNSFVSLSLYATDTKGEITLISSGVTNPAIRRWKYRNIGKTRRMGFELEAEQVFDKLSFNESLSYVDAKVTQGSDEYDIKKGDRIPMVPKTKLTFGAKYDLTENLSVLADYTYVSKKETRELDEEDKVYRYTIDSQGTIDAGLLYKIDDYSNLKFGVKNLTGKKYNLRETRDYAVPAAERNYYLELNVKM